MYTHMEEEGDINNVQEKEGEEEKQTAMREKNKEMWTM